MWRHGVISDGSDGLAVGARRSIEIRESNEIFARKDSIAERRHDARAAVEKGCARNVLATNGSAFSGINQDIAHGIHADIVVARTFIKSQVIIFSIFVMGLSHRTSSLLRDREGL